MTALIWDLDGTLLDSYKIIVPSTVETLGEYGVFMDAGEVHKYLIENSVKALFTKTAAERGLDAEELWRRYQVISTARDGEVTLTPGARETLEALSKLDTASFVYTHKGETARAVLDRLGIGKYFKFVLTAAMGLPRKPAPDGINWLIERFSLDRCRTFYIGDRRIDVECAESSGVGCVLYLPEGGVGRATGRETHVVRRLFDVVEVVKRA